jgi:hypothetical protein
MYISISLKKHELESISSPPSFVSTLKVQSTSGPPTHTQNFLKRSNRSGSRNRLCRRRTSRSPRTCPPHTSIRRSRCLRHRNSRSLSDRDISLTTSLLSLNAHDHVILLAELQTRSFPCAEMVAGVDGATAVHFCADRPVLLEVGVVADDGGSVGALFLPDLIGRAVAVKVAKVVGAGVVGWVVFAHCAKEW